VAKRRDLSRDKFSFAEHLSGSRLRCPIAIGFAQNDGNFLALFKTIHLSIISTLYNKYLSKNDRSYWINLAQYPSIKHHIKTTEYQAQKKKNKLTKFRLTNMKENNKNSTISQTK
jgi:hypothetical protein